LKYLENPHARYVVEKTAQLWLHIPISFEMVKVEDLKRMTIAAQRYALPAMLKSTRVKTSPRLNVLRRGKKHTAEQLAGFLSQNT
jgi:hypothetical protein